MATKKKKKWNASAARARFRARLLRILNLDPKRHDVMMMSTGELRTLADDYRPRYDKWGRSSSSQIDDLMKTKIYPRGNY